MPEGIRVTHITEHNGDGRIVSGERLDNSGSHCAVHPDDIEPETWTLRELVGDAK